MNKLWLLTMTQNSEKYTSEQVKNIYPVFNGIVGLCNLPNTDSTLDILQDNKGDGRILTREFVKHHGHLMSELLFCNHIKENEWCLYLDAAQSCSNVFINILPNLIDEFENKGIGGISWDSRIFLFQYNPYMEFKNHVHWYLDGIIKPVITLPNKEKYIINARENDKNRHYLLNPVKYYLNYSISEETLAMYSKYSIDIVKQKEQERRDFRNYLQNILKLSLDNLDDLIEYMKKLNNKEIAPDSFFINFCDNCFRMTDLFRHKILGQDLIPDIVKNRFNWRLSYYLNTGDKDQIDTGWTGEINLLNKQFGYPPE
jgi:hypothetical protein